MHFIDTCEPINTKGMSHLEVIQYTMIYHSILLQYGSLQLC